MFRWDWRADILGWALMSAIILFGLFGLLGDGPLSQAEQTSPDGQLSVSYERFLRSEGNTQLFISLAPGSARNGWLGLRIDRQCLQDSQVESLQPPPASTTVSADQVIYRYPARDRTGLALRLDMRPSDSFTVRRCEIAVDEGASVQFWQWVHP